MIPQNPTFIPRPFAAEGVAATIPDDKTVFGEASWREGFPTETGLPLNAGGIPPRKADFNGVLKALSDHVFFAQAGSQYEWSDTIDYRAASFVVGSDGNVYLSLQESGPNVAGVAEKDPTLDDGTYWLNVSAKLIAPPATQYELCEFYDFRHPTLRPGMVPRYGTLIQDAATLYPKAWAYLQTTEGQMLCMTESEWWEEYNKERWQGTGVVAYYVIDTNAGTIRVPCTKGAFAEGAGFPAGAGNTPLGVGGVHGPGLPNITGNAGGSVTLLRQRATYVTDFMRVDARYPNLGLSIHDGAGLSDIGVVDFDASRANNIYGSSDTVQPRAYGILPCVYLGS